MKSIMEEASSIAKAIEKGWARAGKPQEFTVKVFEEAEKNFIGLTTKPAKIGLFFQEQPTYQTNNKPSFKERPQQQPQSQPQARKPQPQRPQPSQFSQPAQPQVREDQPFADKQAKKHPTSSPWNDELVAAAQEWVKDSLRILNLENIQFTVEVDRYALKLNFAGQITQGGEKEKTLFRSWAYLIMQALRQKFKRPLKGLKVILMSNA
ncbi:MAG: hypothetical protein NTX86_05550 [Candidatus Dependentiae bacterium]|nr:hypothetical protein [Candidatus Dependentiae bacterium]